jgi:hypothetical protein
MCLIVHVGFASFFVIVVKGFKFTWTLVGKRCMFRMPFQQYRYKGDPLLWDADARRTSLRLNRSTTCSMLRTRRSVALRTPT